MLSMEKVSVNYGVLRALRSADLTAKAGQITAIIGLNGAGKTTLLNAAMGAVPLKQGQVVFNGKDITRMSTAERVKSGLALCPEGRQVFPRMTVSENLRMGGYMLPRHDLKARMEEMLAAFPKLRSCLNQQAGTLSGGQQQWLAIARALMCRPRMLMMDEPTLGLAPEAAHELLEMLSRIAQSGITLLVVEQDVEGILTIADTAYAMQSGECRALGNANAVLNDADFRHEWGIAISD